MRPARAVGVELAGAGEITRYLRGTRQVVLGEIRALMSGRRTDPRLSELMLDYPLRAAKALRPALCIAVCRAYGGNLEDVLSTATALEIMHNAFLVHDDVEDGSVLRRGRRALHRSFGVPIAVNVGDAMLALALAPLSRNFARLPLAISSGVLDLVTRMASETAEGQATELAWIRWGGCALRDSDYLRMAFKKTCWYSFLAPVLTGALIAGVSSQQMRRLARYAGWLGVAFQIQDDVLNLVGSQRAYGKELGGDLLEGKYTLILMHALRSATVTERGRALLVLRRPRHLRSQDDVRLLRGLIDRHRSIDYAASAACRMGERAHSALKAAMSDLAPSEHTTLLVSLIDYCLNRDR